MLRSEGGGQAFGLAGEIHGHAILVQLRVHLPLDQGESASDTMIKRLIALTERAVRKFFTVLLRAENKYSSGLDP